MINKNSDSSNNTVTMTQEDVKKLKLPEQKIIKAFYFLQTDGCLKFTRKGNDDDFSTSWAHELKSDGLHYFEKQLKEQNTQLIEWIRWGITSLIAIAALVVAIIAL